MKTSFREIQSESRRQAGRRYSLPSPSFQLVKRGCSIIDTSYTSLIARAAFPLHSSCGRDPDFNTIRTDCKCLSRPPAATLRQRLTMYGRAASHRVALGSPFALIYSPSRSLPRHAALRSTHKPCCARCPDSGVQRMEPQTVTTRA